MASGQLAVARGWMRPPAKASKRNAATPLSWVGRWSLSWYMVHQPVLIGVLTVASTLR
jgi:peptidoglycan/LPS O-acetylase OafA/YrhL